MYFLFYYFLIVYILSFSKNEKLIFVELQCRHGARAPLELNENNEDILGEKWSNVGELTGIGQRMEYVLGLKNRYNYITNKYKFLSEKFDPHELLVYSTFLNRTLLSMTSQLQGLYPTSSKKGEILNSQQKEFSSPPVNISYEEIEKEINNLNESALPNYMTIIPIHMISPLEKKIVVYEHQDCKPNVEKITLKNKNEKATIINITKFFNNKYSKNLSNFFLFPQNHEYDFDYICKICDALIADYTEGRNMTNFFDKTQIEKKDLIEECKEIIGISFRDKLYGDDKNEVMLIEESEILREMIYYMKKRVDADINGENIEKNVSNYIRPKMVMISGHDVTVAAQVLFFIKFFNLPMEIYKLPIYTSQVAVEVTRNEDPNVNKKLEYSDYNVNYYFNDLLVLKVNLNTFINTIEQNIWSKEQIDNFCFGNKNIDNENINSYIIIIIVVGVFAIILLITVLFLMTKIVLIKKRYEEIYSIENKKLINDDES